METLTMTEVDYINNMIDCYEDEILPDSEFMVNLKKKLESLSQPRKCATCKWWKDVVNFKGDVIFKGCTNKDELKHQIDVHIWIGNDYMYTKPTFGCNFHERRDDD